MANNDFVKGACGHCGGHLEFPGHAAGQTVPCPHCGQATSLAPTGAKSTTGGARKRWLVGLGVLGVVAIIVAGVCWYSQRAGQNGSAALRDLPPASAKSPVAAAPPPAAAPKSLAVATTNEFAILPFDLEKTPGSSLVYVTGVVQNASARQRFGVKVTFGLGDTNDRALGTTTDYQAVMEPHGEWHFRAMVMESQTASARFTGIAEDK